MAGRNWLGTLPGWQTGYPLRSGPEGPAACLPSPVPGEAGLLAGTAQISPLSAHEAHGVWESPAVAREVAHVRALGSELRVWAVVLCSLADIRGSQMLTEHRSQGCTLLPPSTVGWGGGLSSSASLPTQPPRMPQGGGSQPQKSTLWLEGQGEALRSLPGTHGCSSAGGQSWLSSSWLLLGTGDAGLGPEAHGPGRGMVSWTHRLKSR